MVQICQGEWTSEGGKRLSAKDGIFTPIGLKAVLSVYL